MDVVRGWIKGFDELVSDNIDEQKTGLKMQKAIEYIKENYATDLNMAVVSNYISMNYSHLSIHVLSVALALKLGTVTPT